MNLFVRSSAEFSPDRVYRYLLTRFWDDSLPYCNFLMLNPSTADENIDDPTVAKCGRFARMWGFGGLIVTNIFAFRATDPVVMKAYPEPIGPDNDKHIWAAAAFAGRVIVAWGNHGCHLQRSEQVRKLLHGAQLEALQINGTGEPKHPLYISYKTEPIPYLAG